MKVQIDLPQDVYQQLKKDAKAHFQSLRGHIAFRLINLVRGSDMIDLSILPEGTKITATTKTTPKLKIPKRNLIEEAIEGSFFPSALRVHSDDDEPFTDQEYQQELNQLHQSIRNHPDFITLKNYYDSFNLSEEERSEARERLIALRHSKDVVSHETLYLEQIFEYTPPEDEPTLDLSTYISRLLQGGWYDNDCVCLKSKV